jgi:Proliferating cell nuclear antigen, N-terminal domain
MKAVLEFIPKHLEKAIDVARSVATFAQLEFGACLRLRITDPVKVLYMDIILTPDVYKCESDFTFGINLHMFYKLLKTLDNNESIEIEADESIMKLNQCQHYHTLVSQDVPLATPSIADLTGPKLILGTKMLQRYIRALGNVAPVVEMNYVPLSNVLFLESVNSMYRTLFSVDTTACPNDGEEEYRKQFIIKFLDTVINPSLADKVELCLSDSLVLQYAPDPSLSVLIVQAAYTEG